ncbi:MAG: chromate transporter, partial [Eggerthellaceae bacterium]|nr:chromate transporter [Eggerthellaceae bacterium]
MQTRCRNRGVSRNETWGHTLSPVRSDPGGGLASIPFLKEMAVKYGWFTIEDLTTMIAVSESTPGPIGVNMATYV